MKLSLSLISFLFSIVALGQPATLSFPDLESKEISSAITPGKGWRLVKNYVADQKGQRLLLKSPTAKSANTRPVVYHPRTKRWAAITGQLVLHVRNEKHAKEICSQYKMDLTLGKSRTLVVRPKSQQDLIATAERLSRDPRVTAVALDLLAKRWEPK